jgi:hypothetical protein
VRIPAGATHIKTVVGDFYGSDSISDVDLRRMYNAARAVVVPLKDVHQPSGQSVTLQAMSCGRPVVLTKTRGLWAPAFHRQRELPAGATRAAAAVGQVLADASAVPLETVTSISGSIGSGKARSRSPAGPVAVG